MPRDDLEQAFHYATGSCLEAMWAMRRLDSATAIEELQRAIRFIENGRRTANEKLRRERAANRIPIAAPVPTEF